MVTGRPRALLCEVAAELARRGSLGDPFERFELLHSLATLSEELVEAPAMAHLRQHVEVAAMAYRDAAREEQEECRKLAADLEGGV